MKKILYKIWSNLLTHFGNIRISNIIPWLYYDNTSFKVTGNQIEDILEIIEPGCIICRGYDSYLDSKFIPDPLLFSHSGIYIGNNKVIHAVAEGVSEINLIDFCQCDRIAIFRPKKNQRKAISIAKKYKKQDTPYDFMFNNGSNALYCHELSSLCYPNLDLKTISVRKMLFFKKNVYLAESFFKSKDFKCVYQYNPKFNIDYKSK